MIDTQNDTQPVGDRLSSAIQELTILVNEQEEFGKDGNAYLDQPAIDAINTGIETMRAFRAIVLSLNQKPKSLVQSAMDVDGVKSVSVWQSGSRLHACVYAKDVGIEFDCREVDGGWNVNDDDGRNFRGDTLAIALKMAIEENS